VIRLTLRQFRTSALVALVALVAVGIVLAVTGTQLAALYNTTVVGCQAHGDCSLIGAAFLKNDQVIQFIGIGLILIPGVVGFFWGAPLVSRELEMGTHRLVWTQSVTRTRWIVAKIAVVGMASMAVTGLFSLMVTWWFDPIDKVTLAQYSVFDQRDIAPIGYAVFAFVLGVTAGVVIRRMLPAMASTVVAFVAVRMAVLYWVRPNLIPPAHASISLVADPSLVGFGGGPSGVSILAFTPQIPNAWVYSTQIVDKAGNAPTTQFLHAYCPNISAPGIGSLPSPSTFQACIAQIASTFHAAVTYEPANRFWALQWSETGIFLGLTLVLAGLCFWQVRRHIG
jgi:hypothetical protein